jgi:hypothetical protein
MTGWRPSKRQRNTAGVAVILVACAAIFVGDTWFGPGGWCTATSEISDDLEEAAEDGADPDGIAAAQVEVAEDAAPGLRNRAERMIWPNRSQAVRIAEALEAVVASTAIRTGEPGQATQDAVDRFVRHSGDFDETHCSSSDVD